MSRKSSTRATTSLTNSSLDNVDGRDVNLDVSHEEEPNTHNTNWGSSTLNSRGGISSSRDPYSNEIIAE
jgi:hypothetical protein